VAPFSIDDAISIDQLRENFRLLTLEDVIERIFAKRTLSDIEVASVSHGRSIELLAEQSGKSAAFTPEGKFIALLAEKSGRAQPILVLNS
jgi:tRNA pseudouridine55 synthase